MSVYVASLASGSNGNCYYIGNDEEAVLVDAGISGREIEKRMRSLSLDAAKLKALFISHEHTDHISGVQSLVKKLRLPVYITQRTYRACGFLLDETLVRSFNAFEPVQLGGLTITAFPKFHDAIDPHSFIIACAGVNTGVFTDIGEPCKNVIQYFKLCHAIFLETNYDDNMLANSRYPVFLRNRISGKHGHLSNAQALALFTAHRPAFMSHLFLSHLSRENNDPQVLQTLLRANAGQVQIIHASRDSATAVYHLHAEHALIPVPVLPVGALRTVRRKVLKPQLQLSLF